MIDCTGLDGTPALSDCSCPPRGRLSTGALRAGGAAVGRQFTATPAAGCTEIVPSASAWCFATPADRQWWGGMQADRIVASRIAGEAVHRGLCRPDELSELASGWRAWASTEDGWFAVLHFELLCRVAA